MKSKTAHSLIISLIFMVFYLSPVQAVTDAELEALEKQIEQQEADEQKQTEAEAKRRAEAEKLAEEKKRFVELEKKRQEEQRLIEEERRKLEEEKKKLEESRLAELERKRQEEEKKEKYTLLIAEAEQAIRNKDKELAISKYNEALTLTPGDPVANSGIKEAEKLKHKVCYDVLGNWISKADKAEIKEDGTFTWDIGIASGSGTWECSNPKAGKFDFITPSDWISDWTSILNEDGRCLYFWNNDCWTKRD